MFDYLLVVIYLDLLFSFASFLLLSLSINSFNFNKIF